MDIKQLKDEVIRFINAMKEDGKTFTFVALIPTYPGVTDTSYILQVKGDWIDGVDCVKIFDYMVPKMFTVLEQSTREFINRINIYDSKNDLHCSNGDLILINEINYNPANHFISQ